MKILSKSRGGGAGLFKGGDVYMSIQKSGNSRRALQVRVRQSVMDSFRWRIGDRFFLEVDWSVDGECFMTLTAANQSDNGSIAISSNGKGASGGSLRLTPDDREIQYVFRNDEKGFTGDIDRGDAKRVVFRMKST